MKSKLKFEKGEFITQKSCHNSFAIFGGETYDPVEEGGGVDYSLICYYNPNHYVQDSNGKWKSECVFDYDFSDESTCEYTINDDDMDYWRSCTQAEIDEALRTLAKKRFAWIEGSNKLRRLGVNEQLMFGNPKNTGACSGNVNRTSPMYDKTPGLVNPNNSKPTTTRKQITIKVNENWEQKEPITCMDDERRVFVVAQCDKLKYAFDTYQCNSVRIYPQNGAQVPRRFVGGGYPDAMGYGMCAYNALMNGEMWGAYDCCE
jgi:hypothetical protein